MTELGHARVHGALDSFETPALSDGGEIQPLTPGDGEGGGGRGTDPRAHPHGTTIHRVNTRKLRDPSSWRLTLTENPGFRD